MPRRRKRDRTDPPWKRWDRELEELERSLLPYQLHLDEQRKQQYRRYIDRVYSWNRKIALLSRQDVDNLVWKHVGSCLGPLLLVRPRPRTKWVDIGTGAGLPGLILKIWEPHQEIHLVESARKKCIFLQETCRDLGLGSMPIHALRVETWVEKGEGLGQYDVVLTRAVASLSKTLACFGALVRPGGRVLTFKGPGWKQDVEEAERAGQIGEGRFRLEQIVQIPWAPGHLLLLREERNGE